MPQLIQDAPQRTDVKKEFWAARLVALRKKLGLSRKAAGEAWRLSPRTLQEWEQGRKQPHGLYREKLEGILRRIEKQE
jgi:DNA-binding transcriptional regulator YiaG